MEKKKSLGKGLEALLPEFTGNLLDPKGVQEISLHLIQSNPEQPRKIFSATELQELADSIRQYGLIQPIVLEKKENGRYQIVVGERRYLAVKSLGWKTIPAFVKEIDPNKKLEIALIENIQRENLNPIELAKSYAILLESKGWKHEELAKYLSKSRSAITNTLRLLHLHPRVQEALIESKISEGHARTLLSASLEDQIVWLERILEKNYSVRMLELLLNEKEHQDSLSAQAKKTSKMTEKSETPLDEVWIKNVKQLNQNKGFKVQWKEKEHNRGSVSFSYQSMEEKQKIAKMMEFLLNSFSE